MVFQRDGKIIVFLNKQLINFFGFSRSSGAGVADAQIVVGLIKRDAVFNGPSVCRNGFVVLPHLQEHIANIVVSQRVVRGKCLVFREIDESLPVVALIEAGGSKSGEELFFFGIDRERLTIGFRGFAVLFVSRKGIAETEPCVGIALVFPDLLLQVVDFL